MLHKYLTLLIVLIINVFIALSFKINSLEFVYQTRDEDLMRDLLIVDYWNQRINERLPVFYNNILSGGYFNMPSARMGEEGEIGAGFASLHPYRNYNLRFQLLDFLEVTGSYRIYRGVDDPILSPLGFGDLSDKGVNAKLAIFKPEDSGYKLPGLAIGIEDFLGTKGFFAKYIALTKVFLDYNMELTLGYGTNRIKGFFGGLHLMPFRNTKCSLLGCSLLDTLAFAAEYDAVPYRDKEIERHPRGRKQKSKINWGFKYRLFDHIDFSVSRIRGIKWSYSLSTFYNLGETQGFLPKIDNPVFYKGPFNNAPLGTESLGIVRKEEIMVEEFRSAMALQGFELLEVKLDADLCLKKRLTFRIDNLRYALEKEVRERLNYILAYLVPVDIDLVVVVIDEKGLPIHEYQYEMSYVRAFAAEKLCEYELKVLTPLKEVTHLNPESTTLLFREKRNLINFEVLPKTHSFFGSSKGKFKYAVGLNAGFNGFIPGNLYYSLLLGYTFASNLHDLTGVDRLNPSQLINVRTDIIRYYQQRGITFDQAYLQKNWNLGRGMFSKLSLGHFEEAYGGVGTEFLYYPINSPWAFGLQGALLKKRTVRGVGFTNKIRKLEGFYVTHRRFFGSQWFLNGYYDFKDYGMDLKVSAGKFLANDLGIRFELTRHFPSGLRISVWYAHTNGHDRINDKAYYDKGFSISMPLDIFYTRSDRDRWHYGLSAWLRDIAVTARTGDDLYNLIYEARHNH